MPNSLCYAKLFLSLVKKVETVLMISKTAELLQKAEQDSYV